MDKIQILILNRSGVSFMICRMSKSKCHLDVDNCVSQGSLEMKLFWPSRVKSPLLLWSLTISILDVVISYIDHTVTTSLVSILEVRLSIRVASIWLKMGELIGFPTHRYSLLTLD